MKPCVITGVNAEQGEHCLPGLEMGVSRGVHTSCAILLHHAHVNLDFRTGLYPVG